MGIRKNGGTNQRGMSETVSYPDIISVFARGILVLCRRGRQRHFSLSTTF